MTTEVQKTKLFKLIALKRMLRDDPLSPAIERDKIKEMVVLMADMLITKLFETEERRIENG